MDKMKDIGESLKKEREKRDISLEYISSGTNISVNALTSLENGELEQIPGVFYLKNYIKTYLDAIGADSDRFFAEHDQELNSACKVKIETGKPYYTKLKYSRFRKRRVVFSLVLTAIVFVLVFYSLYSNKDNIFGGWNLNRLDIPVPQTGIDFTAGGFPSNSSRDYFPVNITIEFSRECWTQVYRGKEKILEHVYQKGDSLKLAGYELVVSVGNPAGLRFLLNGKEVTYLRTMSKPERIVIKPDTIGQIFAKGQS